MSAQVAMLGMMAASTALSAASSINKGNAQGGAYEGQAMSAELQGKQYDVQIAESRAQAQQEELQRRKGLQRLLSANRADLAGSGVSGDQGSSFDVIQDYNKSQADEDIHNIRFMGESRINKLSFARDGTQLQAGQFRSMAGMARSQGMFDAIRTIGTNAFSMGLGASGLMGGAGGGTNIDSEIASWSQYH